MIFFHYTWILVAPSQTAFTVPVPMKNKTVVCPSGHSSIMYALLGCFEAPCSVCGVYAHS